tara:strand:+ start:3001 stop:5259 length:2259 start_codon:yes stop_codon:yes gene_type:complete
MAIREFGQSLLADVRKRKDDQAEKNKPSTLDKALMVGAAVIPMIGASKVTEQFNNFSQNKEVLDTNIMLTAAERVDKKLNAVTAALDKKGFSAKQYFLEEQAERDMEAALAQNEKFNKDTASQTLYKNTYRNDFMKDQQAIAKAELAASQYEQALEAQERFKASGTKEQAFALGQSKLARGPLTAFFGAEKREAAAVESYRSSMFAQSAGRLAMFDEVLKTTGGDFVEARKIEETLNLDESRTDRPVFRNQVLPEGVVIQITGTEDVNGKITWNRKPEDINRFDIRSPLGKTQVLLAQFNVVEKLSTDIDSAGQKAAIDEGFKMVPKTEAEFETNMEIYTKYIQSNGLVTLSAEQTAGKLLLVESLIKVVNSESYLRDKADYDRGEVEIAELQSNIAANNEGVTGEQLETIFKDNKKLQSALTTNNTIAANLASRKEEITLQVYQGYPTIDPEYVRETAPVREVEAPITNTGASFVGADATVADSKGVRFNNWLNIKEDLEKEKDNEWYGKAGSDGTFLQFETAAQGVRAADKVLISYANKDINTVSDVIAAWAPPTDNNPTEDYIDYVADSLGIDEGAVIDLKDPEVRADLLSAMSMLESEKEVSPDEILSLVAAANAEAEAETVDQTGELADDLDIKIISSSPTKPQRKVLGIKTTSGKSLQTVKEDLDRLDTELLEDLPTTQRKRLLERRAKSQVELDRFERTAKIKDPTYTSTPSKVYAVRMLEEDKRTMSQEDAVANYVSRMKGEIK